MTQNTGRSLGSVTGEIRIDVSSLKAAQAQVVAFAKETSAALGELNVQLSSFARIAQSATAVRVAELRKEGQEAQAAARVQVEAIRARAQADSDATKLEIANAKERAREQSRGTSGRGGAGGGGFGGGFGATIPSFLQFSLIPVQQIASSFGATGVANAVGTGAAFVGLADAMGIVSAQVDKLGSRLMAAGGVIGNLATAGANMALKLGASAEGVGAALGAIGAVLAPVLLVVGVISVFASVLGTVSAAFADARTKAEEYVNKQLEVNKTIAGGGTSEDITKMLDEARAVRDGSKATLESLQPLRDLLGGLTPIEMQAVQGAAAGVGVSQQYLNAAANTPGSNLQVTTQMIRDLSGGRFQDLAAFYGEFERLRQLFVTSSDDVSQLGNAYGRADLMANDLAEANNAVAKASVDAANAQQQLSRASVEQLQQRLSANQAETASINSAYALSSGKQRQNFDERLAQLKAEGDAIANLMPQAVQNDLSEFITKANQARYQFGIQGQRTLEDRLTTGGDTIYDRIIARAREAEDYTRQRALALTDFNKQQARAQEDYLTASTQRDQKFRETNEEAEAEHQDKLAKIIADARINILEAAARLDARGVFEQQRRRNQQLNEENDSARKDRDKRQKQYDEETKDAEAQYEKQRQRQIADFTEQNARADAERRLRAQREEQDNALQDYRQARQYALTDARRQEDFARQIQDLASHYASMATVQDVYQNVMELSWQSFLLRMVQQTEDQVNGTLQYGYQAPNNPMTGKGSAPWYNGAGNSATALGYNYGAGMFPSSFSGAAFPSFAVGIPRVPRDMLAYVHAGEGIISAAQNRSGGMSSTTVHIDSIVLGDIGERSDEDVMNLLDTGLRRFFNQYAAQRGA